jgi:hypothetical protein
VEWISLKAPLRDLVTQHHGRITDFGSAVEMVPSGSGEPIFVAYADVDLVRVDAGWFIRRFVDVDDDMQHLTEVLDALITGVPASSSPSTTSRYRPRLPDHLPPGLDQRPPWGHLYQRHDSSTSSLASRRLRSRDGRGRQPVGLQHVRGAQIIR